MPNRASVSDCYSGLPWLSRCVSPPIRGAARPWLSGVLDMWSSGFLPCATGAQAITCGPRKAAGGVLAAPVDVVRQQDALRNLVNRVVVFGQPRRDGLCLVAQEVRFAYQIPLLVIGGVVGHDVVERHELAVIGGNAVLELGCVHLRTSRE